MAFAAPASAAPKVDKFVDLTEQPKYITSGPDGNIWVTLGGGALGNDIAKITPAGVVTEFNSATYDSPNGITAGPDGNLWASQNGGVVRIDPADPANPTAFPIALVGGDPRGITTGPDGNIWTASGDKVIKIPPADPSTFDDFTVTGMGARGISAGPDLIWVADFAGGRIVSLTTDGTQTPYAVGGGPQEVAGTPGTTQVAYSNQGISPHEIGRITPGGSPLKRVVADTDPFGVTYAADGAWWYAQFLSGDLGRLTKSGTYTTLGGLPAGSGPRQITDGPGRTLWVSLETSHQVARVTGLEPPKPPAPQTVIDEAPPDTVKAGRKGARVKFGFSSPTPMASFECSLKKKGARNGREDALAKYAACESPKKYRKLRKGKYTFRVRASRGGVTDATPAEAQFRVKAR